MKFSNLGIIAMIMSSLFLVATFSAQAAETIIDGTGDVSSIDYFTQETTIVTSHPDINVNNLDIVQATYNQQGTQATVTLQVKGSIENKGQLPDQMFEDPLLESLNFNFVEYSFEVTTSKQVYTIAYVNQTGQFDDGIETSNLTSSDFSVVGNTLSITFQLKSAEEIYENLSVTSMFIKMNLSSVDEDLTGFVWLSDFAPNPALSLYDASAETNIGLVGESLQFNATIDPFTGQPPYTYYWNFGDQSSSTQLNQPKDIEVGGRIVRKGPDGSYSVAFETPKEAPKPKYVPGDIRTLKEGRFEVNYEMQPDGKWKAISRSAMDKPESGVKAPFAVPKESYAFP